jgi:hypothetical protein
VPCFYHTPISIDFHPLKNGSSPKKLGKHRTLISCKKLDALDKICGIGNPMTFVISLVLIVKKRLNFGKMNRLDIARIARKQFVIQEPIWVVQNGANIRRIVWGKWGDDRIGCFLL